ncbi:GtrA family protein [Aliikangiella sp. G2MR2-5]|uniref:GtrA family protein n=1 Tax=Aliikangiella sp. G2MR2-5 TaxID=2788943 RepID=UPI0018AA4C66|nr:GtrA family protein [Aliikangiella sp. G2MR2-5]
MIAIKYTLFAVIATAVNLIFQFFSFYLYTGAGTLYIGMFVGTGAGLVTKYVLDKKYIFYHQPESKAQDLKKFIAYTFTGVFTTVIFWGTELAFDYYIQHPSAKYVGAVLGLSVGYISKYLLDKNYVFTEPVR